jgi:hypothetical protein
LKLVNMKSLLEWITIDSTRAAMLRAETLLTQRWQPAQTRSRLADANAQFR